MSSIARIARQLNFNQLNTPGLLRVGQSLARKVTGPEVSAIGRWGVAVGLIVYWMIEPNFEEES